MLKRALHSINPHTEFGAYTFRIYLTMYTMDAPQPAARKQAQPKTEPFNIYK